jgi:hypothetical protein
MPASDRRHFCWVKPYSPLPLWGHTDSIFQELVIASEAKQSILSLLGEMDCFASLAMTMHKYASTPSPRSAPEPLTILSPN